MDSNWRCGGTALNHPSVLNVQSIGRVQTRRMAGVGRTRPVTKFRLARSELPLIGESGHRNFDEKPRAYEFASGCLGSRLCENSNLFFQVGVQYHYLPKTNMSSQLGTVAGVLLIARWEKFLALREISEFSHGLGRRQPLRYSVVPG